jgi:hypothetical protein
MLQVLIAGRTECEPGPSLFVLRGDSYVSEAMCVEERVTLLLQTSEFAHPWMGVSVR